MKGDLVCVYIYIYIYYLGTKYCTPEISTSEIIVDFRRLVQWISSGMFKHNFTVQWYDVQKDCHLSSELLLELSNGYPVAFSKGIQLA